MWKIVPLFAVMLFVGMGNAQAQISESDASLRDLPRTHWAYGLLDNWDKSGELLSPFPTDYMMGKRNYSRYAFAIMTARALDKMPKPDAEQSYPVPPVSPLVMGILRRFASEFEPEMKRLGMLMPEVYIRLGHREPFPNVPTDYWATSSIERLRKLGILIGDPSGDF